MPGFSCRRLHTKGFLTLCLVIFARQVQFTDAVTFWQRLQRVNDAGFRNFAAAAAASPPSSSTDAANTCTDTSPSDGTCSTSQAVVATPAELGCCQSCPHLIDAASYARLCPRGGHSHAHGHPVVEAAATAALSTPYGLPLHLWKILFQIFLTSLNVACWLIPLKNKRLSENKLGLSLANAFSGGVFLSLAFGHLLPECVHGFHDYNEAVPFLLVLAGYLLIFFVEKVAFDAHGALHNMESGGGNADQGHSHGKQCKADTEAHAHAASSGRSAVILLGALAVHSILEMMALGLADTFSDSALLTLSISLHQPAESIALLVAFLKSGLSHAQIISFLSIFSCMGPIGVGLGMLVNEYAAPIVDSIMLAIVAGTFVYVGATEVIPEEWEDSQHKWKKFAALMAGIVSIIGITQYTQTLGGHSH